MSTVDKNMLEQYSAYPTSWLGGKFRGTIFSRGNYWNLEIKNNDRIAIYSHKLYYNDEKEKETNYTKAQQMMKDENIKNNWPIKNRYRFIDMDTIEVELNNNQIMKTDSIHIDIIQKHLIYSVKSGGKLGKYYAMVYLGKEKGKNKQKMFHMVVTSNKMTDHINRDTLDNRLVNLRATTYEENNDNKTFSTYKNNNSSGTRGVTYNTKEKAWIAKIITNKTEDGKKRTYSKMFKIDKYGNEEAKEMAIKHREMMCEKFNNGEFKALEDENTKEKNRERIREYDEDGKLTKLECKGCDKVLKLDKFLKKGRKNEETVYQDKCKECANKRKREWVAKRREAVKQKELENETKEPNENVDQESEIDENDTNDPNENVDQESEIENDTKNSNENVDHGSEIDENHDNDTANESESEKEIVELRKCTKCREQKELSSEYFYKNKNHESGFEMRCKQCRKEIREKTEDCSGDSETDDKRKKAISTSMTEYYNTEEGKKNKKEAHEKRSDTMKQQRDELRANMTEKECKKCNETKSIDNFCKKSNAKDGLQPYCRECINEIKKVSRLNENFAVVT